MTSGSSKPLALTGLLLMVVVATMIILKLGSRSPPSSSTASPAGGHGVSSTTKPFHVRHSAKGRENLTIAAKLSPGVEILEGTDRGGILQGPVKIAGALPPSALRPSGETGEDGLQIYHVARAESGEFQGGYTVQASSARATSNGVVFQGPLLLTYQNPAGKTYEVLLESKDSFFFISTDGERQVIAAAGSLQMRHADPVSPLSLNAEGAR